MEDNRFFEREIFEKAEKRLELIKKNVVARQLAKDLCATSSGLIRQDYAEKIAQEIKVGEKLFNYNYEYSIYAFDLNLIVHPGSNEEKYILNAIDCLVAFFKHYLIDRLPGNCEIKGQINWEDSNSVFRNYGRSVTILFMDKENE